MPRSLILTSDESIYHCISRCVRQAYLCGNDVKTGKCYNHRKDWVRDRLVVLSEVFTIDVLGYALMSTHSHTMLRIRPDLSLQLTDEEVARRWFRIYHRQNVAQGSAKFEELIKLTAANKERVEVLRKRLVSVSWFMKSLNEAIARRANKEDECKGRFWSGRFTCQKLCDDAAILSCAVYIDLNPIRAKIAKTPESSEYTGVYERIKALKSMEGKVEGALWLTPIQDCHNRKGFLPLSLSEYLTIVDLSGREICYGKRGQIPADIAPILERIGINPESWISTCMLCRRWFGSAIGSNSSLKKLASDLGKAWLKGFAASNIAFA